MPTRVLRIDIATGREELVRRLLPGDSPGVYQVRNVKLTPDGKTYAYGYAQTLSDLLRGRRVEIGLIGASVKPFQDRRLS